MNHSKLRLKIFNILFILFLCSIASVFFMDLFSPFDYSSWQISEFLINYQAGFVRRGLLGELLFLMAKNTNINIIWVIKIISVFCCFFVCGFFTKSFLKKGYSLYLLPLCFFCGGIIMSNIWIRKDFMMFCFFIPTLLIYASKTIPEWIKLGLMNILSVVMILNHEVYVFFSLPFFYIMFFHKYYSLNKNIVLSGIYSFLILLPSILTFLLVSLNHGDVAVSQAIWDSWDKITPEEIEQSAWGNAIRSIGWSSTETLRFHFKINFLIDEYYLLSIWYWLITFVVVYYLVTNTLLVFKKTPESYTKEDRNILSSVFCFQFLCLLPMFVALSVDYIRIFFYLTASSFAIFLIIPKETLLDMFPVFWKKWVGKINSGLDIILSPSRTSVAFLMLIVGISYSGFVLKTIWMSTMIYRIFLLFSQPIILFRDYFLN